MRNDRFKDYDGDVRELVLAFESAQKSGASRYFDEEQIEIIIDFYLDTADATMLERSVRLGERLFPNSNEIRLRRAHLLCVKERYDDALSLLKNLQQIEPGNTDVSYALGAVYSVLDMPEQSVRYYSMAATDGNETDTVYCNMADEYARMERYDDELMYARRALKSNPVSDRAVMTIGHAFSRLNQNEKAVAFFSRYLKEHPYSVEGWYCLGAAYCGVGLYEHAVEAYQYALTVDENHIDAYEQLAAAYVELKQYDRAAAALHDAIKHTDDKSYFYLKLGDLFREQGNLASASVYYRSALKDDSHNEEAWVAMATCYASMGDNYNACDTAAKALSKVGQMPHVMLAAAVIFGECERPDDARHLFEELVTLYPDFSIGWVAYVDFLTTEEDYAEAIDVISRGLPEMSDPMELHLRLVYCCYITGRRNGLYDAVRACLHDGEDGGSRMLAFCPELGDDIEVMDIISSYDNEKHR